MIIRTEIKEVRQQLSAQSRLIARQEKRIVFLEGEIVQYSGQTPNCEKHKPEHKLRISGVQITMIRERLKLSQAEFARLLGVDRACLCRWEKDTVRPSQASARKIKQFRRIGAKALAERLIKIEKEIWNS